MAMVSVTMAVIRKIAAMTVVIVINYANVIILYGLITNVMNHVTQRIVIMIFINVKIQH